MTTQQLPCMTGRLIASWRPWLRTLTGCQLQSLIFQGQALIQVGIKSLQARVTIKEKITPLHQGHQDCFLVSPQDSLTLAKD